MQGFKFFRVFSRLLYETHINERTTMLIAALTLPIVVIIAILWFVQVIAEKADDGKIVLATQVSI